MWTEEEMKAQHAALFNARFDAGVQLARARREIAEWYMRIDGLRWAALKFYPEAFDEAGLLRSDVALPRNPAAPDSLGALVSALVESTLQVGIAEGTAGKSVSTIAVLDADLDGLSKLAFGHYRLDLSARPSDLEIDRAAFKHPPSTKEP